MLVNQIKKNYSKCFNHKYRFKEISEKTLYNLANKSKNFTICQWWYCCYGLYKSCWQDLIEKDKFKFIIDSTAEVRKKNNRILYYADKSNVYIIIIARDILQCDYLFQFEKEE